MKNKILKISLVTVIVISMVVILTGCTKNENDADKNDQVIESSVENIEESKDENNQNDNVSQTTKTEKEIVEELFNEHLELGCEYTKSDQDNVEYEKAEEYKIDKIEVLSGNEKQEVKSIFESSDSKKVNEKDIFAKITYSVKPKNIENSAWIAGNGEIEGKWMVNKVSCVFVHYNNGTYTIENISTGW